MTPSIFWLVMLIVFCVGEALSVGLTSIWFAGGSLGALIVAALNGPLWFQIVVFLVLSAVLLVLARPLLRRFIMPTFQATNADRVIGSAAVVTEEISNLNGTGQVKIGGQEWTARSEHDVVIPAQTKVKVLRIEGVKVFVETI